MPNELDVLRAVDFDWAMHLRSVWSDPPHDVPEFQGGLRRDLQGKLDELNRLTDVSSPLGWVLVGSGGMGKTHLLSSLRRESLARQMQFVLVDMTDVHNFWETVLLGYLTSLQRIYTGDRFQYHIILERLLKLLGSPQHPRDVLRIFGAASTEHLSRHTDTILKALGRRYPRETMRCQEVIRALVALTSDDFTTASVGFTWLQGDALDDDDRRALGFKTSQKPAMEIVRALSWLMSLVGPTVLTFDQLDPIVAQMNLAVQHSDDEVSSEEIIVARSIIEDIARGFGALRDVCWRTWTVISCLETTWENLLNRMVLRTNADRFESARTLRPINEPEVARTLVQVRIQAAFSATGIRPPYETWPIASEAFHDIQGLSPRAILKLCHRHRQRCLRNGRVEELNRFSADVKTQPPEIAVKDSFRALDKKFDSLRQTAEPDRILDEAAEDEQLGALLQAACRAWVLENELPTSIDPRLEIDLHNGRTFPKLHVRLRLVHHDENDREDHFCLRGLQRTYHSAFQARLRAAMTESGIDRRLSFRRLGIVRTTSLPTGPASLRLLKSFEDAGGLIVEPSADEFRTLWAVAKMFDEKVPGLDDWLGLRRPVSQLKSLRPALPAGRQLQESHDRSQQTPVIVDEPVIEAAPINANNAKPEPADPDPHDHPPVANPTETAGHPKSNRATKPHVSAGTSLLLGLRHLTGEELTMPLANMEKHTAILAGAGSGKTVLLRRLVEEAALSGVPSIVIDCANDLSALGLTWPSAPDCWTTSDQEKAKRYHAQTEVLVWTPGRESGNPLVLEPLPDLAAVADDEEQLNQMVDMARESLKPIVAPGTSERARNRDGILSSALRYSAQYGHGSLRDFVELLADLPVDAGLGVSNETKHARAMSDRLRGEIETNPLLRCSGSALDPALLFGDDSESAKVRVSVINLSGLTNLEMQRQFLNQLAMTLFSWIKRNPSPPGRMLRGLLAIDEAKDYVPSRGSTTCKQSLLRLTAQARKYHLGMIFATQHPREIDNGLIGNCSTHFYGKANSPAAIETIQDQIRLRNGTGQDIARLPKGQFYVYNADANMKAPIKVRVPLCLSHHGANPLEEDEIAALAAVSRESTQPATATSSAVTEDLGNRYLSSGACNGSS